MAKRDEYPQNKSVRARAECMMRGLAQCQNILRIVQDIAIEHVTNIPLRERLQENIKEAIEAAELASKAGSGYDED